MPFQLACRFFGFSLFTLLITIQGNAQEIVSLGEFGSVRVTYMVLSKEMGDTKAIQIDYLDGTVDMRRYPDAKLLILIQADNLASNHSLYICPECYAKSLKGFLLSKTVKHIVLKGEESKVHYTYNPDLLNATESLLKLSFYVKKGNDIVGNKAGYHSRGKEYKLIYNEKGFDVQPSIYKNPSEEQSEGKSLLSKHSPTAWKKQRDEIPAQPTEAPPEAPTRYNKKYEIEDEQTTAPGLPSLAVSCEVDESGNILLSIEGGKPPYELRFYSGEIAAYIHSLGDQTEKEISTEEAKTWIGSGEYRLQVYDDTGDNVAEARCLDSYIIKKSRARPTYWLIVLAGVLIVFFAGYQSGARKRK